MAAFTPVKVLLADFFFVCRRLKAYPVVTLSILGPWSRFVISHLGVAIAGRQSYWWRCWHQPRFIYESSISIWHPMGTTIVIAIPASSFSQNRIYIDLGVGSKTNFKGLQMSLFLAAFAICKLFIYFLNDHINFIYLYILPSCFPSQQERFLIVWGSVLWGRSGEEASSWLTTCCLLFSVRILQVYIVNMKALITLLI